MDKPICDVIKQNQSDLGNIDFKIEPNKAEMSSVSYCFWHPLTAHIFGTDLPISMGFSAKCSCENNAFSQIENWKMNLTDFTPHIFE